MKRKQADVNKKSDNNAFTLIELLAVIVLISIVVLIAIPVVLLMIERSQKEAFRISVNNILRQLELEQAIERLPFSGVGQNNEISYSWVVPEKEICLSANNRKYEIVNMNCTDSEVVKYGEGEKLRVTSVTGNPTNYTNNNVTLAVTAAGGVEPYKYSFDDGATYQDSNEKEFFENTTVNINVKDATGTQLEFSYQVVIDKIDKVVPTISLTDNYIEINQNDTINLLDYVNASDNVEVKMINITGNLSTIIIGTYTVTYQAEDLAGNLSEQLQLAIRVKDTGIPTVELSNTDTNWYNTDVIVTVTATDAEGGSGIEGYVYCLKTDDSSCLDTDYSSVYTNNQITITDEGYTKLSVKAKDVEGNYSTPVTRDIKIDKTSPTITINGSPTPLNIDHSLGSPFTIPTAVVSDSLSGIKGSVITTGTVSEIIGTYTITYTASDNANNISYFTLNVNVIDTTAPSITLEPSSPNASGWYTSDISILVTAIDNDNIDTCEYKVSTDGGLSYPPTWINIPGINNTTPKAITIPDESNNIKVMVRCTDNSSKFNEAGTVILKHDETPPSCVSSGGNTTWTNVSRTLTGTCSDTLSGCIGNVTKPYTANINSTTESPGSVTDVAGNSTVCPANQTVKVDKTTPSCVSSGGSTTWTNANMTLTGTCSDTGGSGCSGNVTKQYTTSTNSTAESPGSVTDVAGNSTACPADQTVKVDKAAPSCASSGGSVAWTNANMTLTGTCSDTGGSGCSGNVTKSYTVNTNSTTESPGSVTDVAGNNTACPASQTVRIDKTAPTCASSGGSAAWTNGNITLTGTCSDTGGSGCSGNVTKPYTANTNSTTESPGSVADVAGNSGTCPGNQTVRIDKTAPAAPTVNLNGYTSGAWTNQNVTTTLSASDGLSGVSGFQYSHDNASWTAWPSNPWTISWDGSWAFYTRTIDNAGNASGSASPYVINRDTVPPAFTYFYIGGTGNPASVTSTSTTLYFSVSGATEMCISTTTGCSAWEAYAGSKAYTLSAGYGTKTLYAWFRDGSGNQIGYYSDSVNYLQGAHTDTYTCGVSGYSSATMGWSVSTSTVIQGSTGSYTNYYGVMYFGASTFANIRSKSASYNITSVEVRIKSHVGYSRTVRLYVGGPCPTPNYSTNGISGSDPTAIGGTYQEVTVAANAWASWTITNATWINALLNANSACLFINRGDSDPSYWEGDGALHTNKPVLEINWTPK